jgi:hypothetical protein
MNIDDLAALRGSLFVFCFQLLGARTATWSSSAAAPS